jgi:hypothetical protein
LLFWHLKNCTRKGAKREAEIVRDAGIVPITRCQQTNRLEGYEKEHTLGLSRFSSKFRLEITRPVSKGSLSRVVRTERGEV